jgi:hypothetical protein
VAGPCCDAVALAAALSALTCLTELQLVHIDAPNSTGQIFDHPPPPPHTHTHLSNLLCVLADRRNFEQEYGCYVPSHVNVAVNFVNEENFAVSVLCACKHLFTLLLVLLLLTCLCTCACRRPWRRLLDGPKLLCPWAEICQCIGEHTPHQSHADFEQAGALLTSNCSNCRIVWLSCCRD